jgi:hypothetical protein
MGLLMPGKFTCLSFSQPENARRSAKERALCAVKAKIDRKISDAVIRLYLESGRSPTDLHRIDRRRHENACGKSSLNARRGMGSLLRQRFVIS